MVVMHSLSFNYCNKNYYNSVNCDPLLIIIYLCSEFAFCQELYVDLDNTQLVVISVETLLDCQERTCYLVQEEK